MREHPLPGWKCEHCGGRNEEDVVSCACCETPRPGTESYADLLQEDVELEPSLPV